MDSADSAALAAASRVRAASGAIADLFASYDRGLTSLESFRSSLRGLGIPETAEATRLLSGASVSFTSLLRALSAVGPGASAGAPPPPVPAPAPVPVYGAAAAPLRRLGGSVPRPGESQLDPVSWSGSEAVAGPGHLDRRAFVSPYNTAQLSNVLMAHPTRKGREDRSRLDAETGAGNLIYNRGGGESAPGAEYAGAEGSGFRFDRELNRKGRGDTGAREMADSGAGALLYPGGGGAPGGPPAQAAHERFESHGQRTGREGLHGPAAAAHRPATSAGYGTSDGDATRRALHEALRLFSAGGCSGAQLRARLAGLGAHPLPPAADKALRDAERPGGALDFGRAARAFEDFLAGATTPAPRAEAPAQEPPPSARGGVSRADMLLRGPADLGRPARPAAYAATPDLPTFTRNNTVSGKFYSTHVPPDMRSHGDIVGWQGETTAREWGWGGRAGCG